MSSHGVLNGLHAFSMEMVGAFGSSIIHALLILANYGVVENSSHCRTARCGRGRTTFSTPLAVTW